MFWCHRGEGKGQGKGERKRKRRVWSRRKEWKEGRSVIDLIIRPHLSTFLPHSSLLTFVTHHQASQASVTLLDQESKIESIPQTRRTMNIQKLVLLQNKITKEIITVEIYL
jgi:hypothetical protein